VQQAFAAGTFSPGLWFQPGLKVAFQSRLMLPTRTKGPPTFNPGWQHELGLKGDLLVPIGVTNPD
jgi:hypothetical protein